jgi:hypothetical protein
MLGESLDIQQKAVSRLIALFCDGLQEKSRRKHA